MVIRISLFLFIALSLMFSSCGSESPEAQKGTDSMAKFTKEEAFREAHEKPEKLEFTGKGKMITFETSDGKPGSAYAIINDLSSNKALFVVHEWWGLNDHIKKEADRLYSELEGVNVLALDMYDGKVTDKREDAAKFMQGVNEDRLNTIIRGAMKYVGEDAKIATIGWCFGGGWSLKASILAEERGAGCVIYYGMPVSEPAKLTPLKADVLGLFAEKDGWITPEIVNKFSDVMKAIGKNIETRQFDAEHGFANPSSPRYKEAAAQEANVLALDFLKARL